MSEIELDSSINNYIEVKSNNIKQLDWDMAIGLQKVDNLKNSKYLGKLLKENVIGEKLSYYLTEHKDIAIMLVNKFIKAQVVREAARKARDEARNGKDKNKKERALSGKLTPAQGRNPAKNELFLVLL